LNDMFGTPCMAGSSYYLMGPTMWKLEKMKVYADQIIEKNHIDAHVVCTTDRREALQDADFVVLVFYIGGNRAFGMDVEIPQKYGINQCIGDSMGPGGFFSLFRQVPLMLQIGKEMDELSPNAYVLNYVNPMGAMCTAIHRGTNMKAVGLCHGVQTTMDLISAYTGVPKNEIDYVNAGINHMDWFLKLEHNGQDLYPILKANMEKPEYYKNEKVRGEVMRQCGYFMTESTGHLSEYLPWFRKNQAALDKYCDEPMFGGETGAYLKFKRMIQEKFKNTDVLSIESGELEPRSKEYCSYIMEAIVTGIPFKFSGNVPNNGHITNLPANATVEVPVFADKYGFHPTFIGDLPKQCAAMNMSNIIAQDLAADAAIKGDVELAFWAIAMDPLTSAVCTLKQIRDMVNEMFLAEKEWLPQFNLNDLRKLDDIVIPEGTIGVDVPEDPALAINHRYSILGQ
ncbi:MAG: hypothetical protein IJ212_06290, partial [Bacteroidaceae bacterium]|nr:hypothetical protein [Bacteroidaceae bacterium]